MYLYHAKYFFQVITNTSELDNDVSNNELINNKNQDVEFEIITNISESLSITNLRKNKEGKKQREHENLAEVIQRQHLRMINMRRKMKALRKTIHTLQTKMNNNRYKAALNSIFTEDQIQALFTEKRSIRNWSHKTVHRALQLKFVCGNNGYEELIQHGYPFPSLKTLRRKLEDFKFEPGISNKMFEFLIHKKPYLEKEADLECGLVFDEMAITPKKCYNSSTGSLIGDITFPNEKDNC
ncbi:uncharacterized protein LOC115241476 isoform X2 [Formica exsecta]|uniref:uncharacterized protein LOC115241476 isoform X2 n=1 Tax=Formica exsecta TaxID=72781 RepID=UPI0011448293|nr:uncharacterized protein LOC115241476 isoform X2 [Formica exsecta]